MEMMQALRADGLGTADHSALAYYEKLAKVEVTRCKKGAVRAL
jgi:2-hydroxy-3-oxopropionate reductase